MNILPLPTAATSRRIVCQQRARERTSNDCLFSHDKRHRVQPSKSRILRRSPACLYKRRVFQLRATEEDSSTTEGDSVETPADASDTTVDAARLLAEIVANPLFYLVAGLGAIKLVASLGEQVGAIVLLSALPVVGLTLISKSDAGKKVEENLKAQLPELEAAAALQKEAQDAARANSEWYGEGRPMWLGPLGASYEYPKYLKGEAAGDYGFDPLGFSSSPESFARNQECELLHARWAMLAVVGCLIPEALAMNGVELGEAIWWKVGAEKLNGDFTINYAGIEGFRIAGKAGIAAIATCQVALMGGPEYARYVGIKSLEPVGIFLPGNINYPGGQLFDPLDYSKNADELTKQAVMEIKHGRMAMLGMLGYFVQAAVTKQGPLQNLVDFLEDPSQNNIFQYLA